MLSLFDPITLQGNQIAIDDIEQHLENILHLSGEMCFSYSVINKLAPEEPFICSSFPAEWVKKYINHGLYRHDPVLKLASHTLISFRWNQLNLLHANAQDRNFFRESVKYNLLQGFTLPLHDYENNIATLNLCSNSQPDLLTQRSIAQMGRLYVLFLSIHHRFLQDRSRYYATLHDKMEKKLTSRETQVLHWASIGKTYREIAIIMGITESTVKFHIGNLITKLDVINAKQAIKKASDLHLFDHCR